MIELHLSNPHKRESFRKRSFVADRADGVILGLGPLGYPIAVEAAARMIEARKAS